MKITIFGSCRQYAISNHYPITSIQEMLTYPHYSKEVIQAIEFCKGIHTFDNKMSKVCFRTGILTNSPILNQKALQEEFNNTDIFIVEIASRISYEYNNIYVHHILTEEKYGFNDIKNIRTKDLTDEEIEHDLVRIKELLSPKKLVVVPHVYTRTTGKRYELVMLLERLCTKYSIPFMNPSELLKNYTDIYDEKNAYHYNQKGHTLIGYEYKKMIESLLSTKQIKPLTIPSYLYITR